MGLYVSAVSSSKQVRGEANTMKLFILKFSINSYVPFARCKYYHEQLVFKYARNQNEMPTLTPLKRK